MKVVGNDAQHIRVINMTYRITQRDLENQVIRLSEVACTLPYHDAGCPFSISYAYGGTDLVQIMASGGERSVFQLGYQPKRATYYRLLAYIDALLYAKG